MRKQQAIKALLEQKLLPLFYNDSVETSIAILRALYDAGIRTVEYTNRGENALKNFIEMKKAAEEGMPGMLLGIGTIKTKELDNFQRDWPNIIVSDDLTIKAVDEKWNRLGLGEFLPSPSLKFKGQMYGEEAVVS